MYLRTLFVCAICAITLKSTTAATQNLNTRAIAAGTTHSLALRSDGTVWAFGTSTSGALGLGSATAVSSPTRIAELSNIVAISASPTHSLAVDAQGGVWAWGTNTYGQLGTGNLVSTNRPTKMNVVTNGVSVSAGLFHSLIVLADGHVMGCGYNGAAGLGDGSTTDRTSPVPTAILTNAVEVAVGPNHSMARTADGKAWVWGYNLANQFGLPGYVSTNKPAQLSLSGVAGIAAGQFHSLVLVTNGQVYAMGTNNLGQLGITGPASTNVPAAIPGLTTIKKISASASSSSAMDQNGQVLIWGQNYVTTSAWPNVINPARPLTADESFVTIAQGDGFVLAISPTGSVWARGLNTSGQLGDGYARSYLTGYEPDHLRPRFSPFPVPADARIDRGDPGQDPYNSRVVPLDFEQAVALPGNGTELYSYPEKTPWFLRAAKTTVQHAQSLNGSSLNRFPVENPLAAFGREGGGSRLYTGQAYSVGIFGGLFDETQTDTNVIRISAYDRSGLSGTQTNVSATATWTIGLPKRFSGSDWANFATNGFYVQITTNGLTTRVEFVDGQTDSKPWSIDWLRSAPGAPAQVVANTVLAGIRLTHTATGTNYYYKIEFKGRTQTSATALTHFAIDGSGNQAWLPMYTLDFDQRPAWREHFLDTPHFAGIPLPPEYAGRTAKELAGLIATPTATFALTNDSSYLTLDGSPELTTHPLLDQLVTDLGNDPIALASYVVNEIGLSDPLMLGEASQTSVRGAVSAPGVKRSALGVLLEGQGSPTEQCALLVYLLRKAGVSAGYAFPTSDNLRLLDTTLSRLWRIQVKGVTYDNGIPALTNALVLTDYPWVVANIGSSTVHIFPWLKDYEIVEGENLYDYMPAPYDNAYKWVKGYCLGNSDILSTAPEDNAVSVIWPKFIANVLSTNTLNPSVTIDRVGVRTFNRRHQFPTWASFPKPNYLTNQNSITVVPTLTTATNVNTFLAGIMDKIKVTVYKTSITNSNQLFTTGDWLACDLNDRKLLVYPDTTTTVGMWLAPRRPLLNRTGNFTVTGGYSVNPQFLSTSISGTPPLLVQVQYTRRSAGLSSPNYYFPVVETTAITNQLSCVYGDVAAVCLSMGAVTPNMVKIHAEDYWQQERIRLTNNSYLPSKRDNEGTAAMLLGMGFFAANSQFSDQNLALHKLTAVTDFGAGLGVIGKVGTNKVQPKVDMHFSEILRVGNGGLHPDTGDAYSSLAQNALTINIAGGSALEHRIIQTTFQDNDSVSTVRLLQLASQRATNSVAGPLELNSRNYASLGDATFSGYGTNKLKDQDAQMWQSITNAFAGWDGDYVRVLITPGPVTNNTGSYKGMGALILTAGTQSALISGNMASLNGGWGSKVDPFSLDNLPSGVQLQYGLQLKNAGYVFYYNQSGNPVPLYQISPGTAVNLDTSSGPPVLWTPVQTAEASQVSAAYNLSGGDISGAIKVSDDTGNLGLSWADIREAANMVYDPVSVITGSFYVDTTDLSLPGPFPLSLRRNYTSLTLADNQFGFGWKMNFMPFLVILPNGTNPPLIQAADADGAVITYRSSGLNYWTVSASDNPTLNNNTSFGIGGLANAFNAHIEKYPATNTYVLFGADGSKRTYLVGSYPITSGSNVLNRQRPYLIRWEDHAGNFHTFKYGTDITQDDYGQVNRIESSNGNALVLKYDFFGRIVEAFTADGRRLKYEYDSYGDLVSVQLPDASQWTYEYDHYTFTTNSVTYTDSSHLLKREVKPDGRIIENGYDSLRRVITQAATVGKSGVLITNATFAYSNNFTTITNGLVTGNTSVRDVFTNPTVYYYTNSLIGRIVDPLNQTVIQDWFETTETNKTGYYQRSLEATTDKRGLQTLYQYDTRGNITTLTAKGNLTGNGVTNETAVSSATFTTQNVPQSISDAVGRTTQFFYDDSADLYKLTRTIQSVGATFIATNKLSYTNVSEVITLGSITRTNQVFALKSEEVRADSSTNRWTYNSQGFPTSMTRVAQNAEDTNNVDPNVTLTFSYNQRGQVYEQTDAAGRKSRFDFDAVGRILWREVLDESGNAVSREQFYYNRNGELEWYDGPASDPEDYVHYDYDGAGRKVEETHWQAAARLDGSAVELKSGDALYATTFFDYDGFGNLVRTIDPRGVTTTNRYDVIGQLLISDVLKNDGSVMKRDQFQYEPGGLVNVQTNALGAVSRVGYTSAGSPYIKTNFDGSISQWRYDVGGRKVKEILRNGSSWETTYDDANLRITNTFKNSANTILATKTTQLDRRGNIIRTVDPLGNSSTNVFDGLNRIRTTLGPLVSFDLGTNAPPNPGSPPPPVQQVTTTYYDASGIVTTKVNALGEKVIETRDALGRQTKLDVRDSLGTSIRVTSTGYFTNFHGAAITEGTGNDAITRYVLNDNQGRTVATVAYPSQYVMEYTINNFDPIGNLLSATRYANNRGVITQWQAATNSYDELNRVSAQIEKDNATTTFAYDALGGLTNRVNPGGLTWCAAYNNAGQVLKNWNLGTNSTMVRSNNFTYYTSGNWVGLLSTFTDARGVVCTHSYDDWQRPSIKVYSGSLAEQQMTNTFAFDARGSLTNAVEQFASGTTGPTTVINRSYDAYGKLLDETTTVGGVTHSTAAEGWDSGGRRASLNVGIFGIAFGSRADGLITSVAGNDGINSAYGYSTAGLLNSRTVGSLVMSVTGRDGLGRILGRTTTVNGSNRLVESLGWTDDGLLSAETLVRSGGPSDGNFTDNRSYVYAPQTRRLAQEKINTTSSTSLTTQFQYDKGATGGAGILTTIADSQTGGAAWNADIDEFRRIKQETNNVVRRFAYGRVNGSNQVASVSVFLDSKPLPVTTVGTSDPSWPLQWWAYLELLPGSHSLQASVAHASGTWITNKTLTFTNNAVDQTTLSYFSEGQLTQRVWKATSGATNRTQNLVWDGKGRLMKITERDSSTNGYDWTATYDALGRRLQTVTSRVVQGTNLTTQPTVAKSFYDPEVEFLEIGVSINGKTSWKLYGPDANGRYGGLQGVGGLDAISEDPGTVYLPIVDALGNILGHYDMTHGTNGWHSSRVIGYGAVSESRPLSLGESPNLSSAAAWRGKTPDLSGFYWLGARYYDPVSGRFISCDPLGYDTDPSLYAFCNGDPINRFDPDGRVGKDVVQTGAKVFDFTWNAVMSGVFINRNPESTTPESVAAQEQIFADSRFASPLRQLGVYDSTPATKTFVDGLGPQLGGPLNDATMAFGMKPGAQEPVGPMPERQFTLEPLMLPAPKEPLLLPAPTLDSTVATMYQNAYDTAWQQVVSRYNEGKIIIPADVPWQTTLGQRTDAGARDIMRDGLAAQGMTEGRGGDVMLNRRLYDPSGSGAYRIPDVNIPSASLILDGTIGTKTLATPQIQDFMNWGNSRVNIVSPSVLPKP